MLFNIIGLLSIAFTVAAYSSATRPRFLVFNMVAVTCLGVCLINSNGIIGGIMSFWCVFLYMVAYLIPNKEKLNKRLALLTPPISFVLYLVISDHTLINLLPAVAYVYITASIFKESIVSTKKYLLVGCMFWLFYTISVGNPFPIIADVIGISILAYELSKLYFKTNGKQFILGKQEGGRSR